MKKILKSEGMKAFAGRLASAYIWFVYKTSRWDVIKQEAPHQFIKEKKPFILAFWHGRLLMMPTLMTKDAKAHVMISHHGDGEIISRAIQHWRLKSIRGSSSKGALAAIKEFLKVIRKKEIAVITPDGPRGPRMHAQEGVVRLAAMSGVPVFPASFSTSRGKRLKSWDHFWVAKPFSKGVIIWDDPIYVPREDNDGAHQKSLQKIEESLTRITQEADIMCGHIPVEPAETRSSQQTEIKVS